MPKLAGGERLQGPQAPGEFARSQAALAVERAQKIRGRAVAALPLGP